MLQSEKIRLLFFCGERSRWGFAHLLPLLSSPQIEVAAVVLATDGRWATFRQALSGETIASKPGSINTIKKFIRSFVKNSPPTRTEQTQRMLEQKGVRILYCDDVNSNHNLQQFQKLNPDMIFSAAYPQIFKSKLLSLYAGEAYNSHPSLLPRCRGAHPVFWAIASGENESGGTIHYMTTQLDQGDIVAQVKVELLPTDNYTGLYSKLEESVPELVSKFIGYLNSDKSGATKQDNSQATYFRNDRLIHRRIFWAQMTACKVHNLVRACNGNAYCWYRGRKILVKQTEVAHENRNVTNNITIPAGAVVDIANGVPVIAVNDGYILLKDLKISGQKKFQFEVGEVLC